MIEEILNINLTQTKDASNAKLTADIEVLSQKVPFWFDTGAKCKALTLSNYQELMHGGELKGSHRVLQSYSNHKLKPMAAVDLRIKYKSATVIAEFEIVDISQENVLSGERAEALGLVIRLDALQPTNLKNKEKCSSGAMETQIVPAGLDDYPEFAHTTGTLPGKYTIKIDPNAKGLVHPVRRQPAALRKKIIEKLQEMVKNGLHR